MLIPLKREEFDQYIDFIYALALDPAKSGYPTYADGIKTKADFVNRSLRAFERENEGILLYERAGRTAGWIHYYYLSEDKYLDTCSFCVEDGMGDAIEEFVAFAHERFPGSELYLGFPGENTQAKAVLEAEGFTCIERAFNDVFDLGRYEPRQPNTDVIPVTRENFELFRALHAGHEEMYWNSDRLLANMDDWRLLLYMPGGVPMGALQARKDSEMGEIFGMFFPAAYDAEAYWALVTAALNGAKADGAGSMVFFNDRESQADALALGFRCVGEYMCYQGAV